METLTELNKPTKVKFGVVGAGMIGKRHIAMINANPECTLVAVCDVRAKADLGLANDVPCYHTIADMLGHHPEIDVVCVCTPNGLHADMAVEVLNSGRHVVIEKPLALNVADARRIEAAQSQLGKHAFLVLQNRYSMLMQWLKHIVSSGQIGEVRMVNLNCMWNRDDRYYKPGHWHGTLDMDGGTLYTQYLHYLDILYWVFGNVDEVVSASFADFAHERTSDFEDSGSVLLRMGNAMCTLTYTTAVSKANAEVSLVVVGSKGTVRLGGNYMNKLDYCTIDDCELPDLSKEEVNPNDYGGYQGSAANHRYVIDNVAAALLHGGAPSVPLADGGAVIDIIDRIYAHKDNSRYVRADVAAQHQSSAPTICVVGLGYVGLPLANAFARKYNVIGYDVAPARIEAAKASCGSNMKCTSDESALDDASIYVITVQTPVDANNKPDLCPLLSATEVVARHLKKGDTVVYESTVYPGCTEEECVPLIEQVSGLKFNVDFGVGYSPERVNPGDGCHTVSNVTKVVAASNQAVADLLCGIYSSVIAAGVFRASSIKVAEAAKVIENTQRDVNIALVNEVATLLEPMGVDTNEVIATASTKWNFVRVKPGLVGGHCIGVDPYYLIHKARAIGAEPKLIECARIVNNQMCGYVAEAIVSRIEKTGVAVGNAKVLVMGVTYKENVPDIRNSKVFDVIEAMRQRGVEVDVVDCVASPQQVADEYGVRLLPEAQGRYNAVLVAVPHAQYAGMSMLDVQSLLLPGGLLADLKGAFRGKSAGEALDYWSL